MLVGEATNPGPPSTLSVLRAWYLVARHWMGAAWDYRYPSGSHESVMRRVESERSLRDTWGLDRLDDIADHIAPIESEEDLPVFHYLQQRGLLARQA